MYEKITLDNNIRIVFEKVPYVRSVSLGIWVGSGSRYEKPGESGASHFIEHMVFKGTNTHTAADLANIMDEVGGQINAFTTKECTCFYGRVLDSHLGKLLDVLGDMFFHSNFDDEDVSSERGVIFEEIGMYEDSPEDLVTERLFSAVYKGTSLSRPILGKKSTLDKMTGDSLKRYMQKQYQPEKIVIALSGNITDQDIDSVAKRFSHMKPELQKKNRADRFANYQPAIIAKKKSIEQNHLCLAFPGISVGHIDRYAMQLLSGILGGGMSSRLFQTVREDRGLCYSIYTFGSGYRDTGLFGIYTALGKETEGEALKVIFDEIKRFKNDGVTADELQRTREQVKANVLMNLESTNARMNRLGKNELYLGYVPSTEEMIESYDAVTIADILKLSQYCLDLSNISLSTVGKTDTADQYREIIRTITK